MTAPAPDPASSGPADLVRRLLDLTIEQRAVKRAVDLLRADLDAAARTEFATSGVVPSWKIPGLGSIALDGAAETEERYVDDHTAYGSYIAERFPSETVGVITVPGSMLEAALEALRFAEVDVTATQVSSPKHNQAAHLDTLETVDLATDDAHPDRRLVDADGQVVPGAAWRLTSSPRLVVRPERTAVTRVEAVVDADHEALQQAAMHVSPTATQPDDQPAADPAA